MEWVETRIRMKLKTALTVSLVANVVFLAAVALYLSIDEELISTPAVVYPQSATAAWPLKELPAPTPEQASLSE